MNSPFQSVVPAALSRRANIVSWVLQVLVAVILFQTLFFKFTAAEESVYIFTKLDMEPWGRIASGTLELIACVLILIPRTLVWGSLLALGVITGAIVGHLTKLGIVVKGDGGLLFGLALVVFASGIGILWLRRSEWRARLDRLIGMRLRNIGKQVVQ